MVIPLHRWHWRPAAIIVRKSHDWRLRILLCMVILTHFCHRELRHPFREHARYDLKTKHQITGVDAIQTNNMPDFSRYSKASVQWQWLYVPMLPLVFTFISFIGIAATSAGQEHYGQLDWNPANLIANWPNRSCKFFAAFAFSLAALGVNISANSLSAANDLAALFPSYINIRRGQLLCALVAWIMVPWRILATASGFLNFMSAYSVFLGPIAAILVWDFWWIHDMKYDVVALYHPEG